jgi:AcrR family transcriptional regulator
LHLCAHSGTLPGVGSAPAAKPLRRERRKLEVRGRIVDAAIRLFDEHGFEATKVADICERADVVNKTFFNHFPTKQHLLREIAESQITVLFADIETVRARRATTREQIATLFERIADNVDAAGPMRRELVTEMIHATESSGNGSVQSRRLQDAFAAMIRDGRVRGDVLADHPIATQADLVLGTFYALMFAWAHATDFPLRRRALGAARLLGDALCGPKGRSKS